MCALQAVTCTDMSNNIVCSLTVTNTFGIIVDLYTQSPLMATFDPDYIRIMGHALRYIPWELYS